MSDALYLRPNVVVEPLFNRWYAWAVLIPPVTAPHYIAHHARIMKSFVSAPQVHAAAVKNPALLGGPFISYPANRAADIQRLLDKTLADHAEQLAFGEAIQALTALLAAEGTGFSLEPVYPKVPELLRGYVELGYDVSNRPCFRPLEALLYRSRYYREASQSVALWALASDDRPFVFATPRLPEPGRLELAVPFRHEGLDALVRMRDTPASAGDIRALVGSLGGELDDALLATLFTETAPQRKVTAPPEGVRIRYFGHACLLIESRGVSILTDPVLSYPYDSALPRYTYDDLPAKIDYVLITHAHADHLMFETLIQLRDRIGTIVVPRNNGGVQDPSLRLILQHTGFKNVRDLDELESIEVENGAITGYPFLGEHGDLFVRSKTAYHVRLAGRSIVIAADSNAIEPRLYDHLHDVFGDVDALFLGMECEGAPMSWIYGPLMTTPLPRKMDQTRRLDGSNCARAEVIVDLLRAKRVYVYAMGQEPWLTHVMALKYTEQSAQIVESNRLLEHCRAKGIVAERPFGRMDIEL